MKRTKAAGQCFFGLMTIAVMATFSAAVFASGPGAAPSQNELAARRIKIVDQNGRVDPGAQPSATSQIVDVSVGPGGSLYIFAEHSKHLGGRHGKVDLGEL